MKKNIILIAAMAVAAVACTKEVDNNLTNKTVISVTTAETKTAFGEKDGTSIPVLWNKGDKISVNGVTSDALASGGSSSATFTFDGTLETPYNAVYPASAVVEYTAEGATIIVPGAQNHTAGSFDPKAGILVGSGNEEGITMVNTMAYLKVILSGGGNKTETITVKSNGGEALSGRFTTDFATMTPAGSNSDEITVDCNHLDLGTEIIIALPAQTYAQGIKVTITDELGNNVEKTSTKSATMAAGHLYSTTINATADEYFIIGSGFDNYTGWEFQTGLRLVPQGDGTYVSDRDIYLNKWCYFRIAKTDWSEDYSRVQDAADYWSVQPKASGDEEPFIPGNADSSWQDGYYMVMFNKNTMKVSYAYVGGTENQPFYLNGGAFNDGSEDWALVDDHKLDRVASGIYRTTNPVQLKDWVYFKFDTADWAEYVRSQADGVNYWTATPRIYGEHSNDCNFIPKNNDNNWKDGLYNVTLNLRTMSVSCEYYGLIPGTIDSSVAFYIYGCNFEGACDDWTFSDDMALMPTAENENIYKTVKPVTLAKWCYFKFEKKDWTEYVRDQTVSEYWTVTARTHEPDNDKGFSPGDTGLESGTYNVTLNLDDMSVTLTAVE